MNTNQHSESYNSIVESFSLPRKGLHVPHTVSTELLDSSFSPDPYNVLMNTNTKLNNKIKTRRNSAVDLLK